MLDGPTAVDECAELAFLVSEEDDDDSVSVLKHSTVYAGGLRCIDYEVQIRDEDGLAANIMLTFDQVLRLSVVLVADMMDEHRRITA